MKVCVFGAGAIGGLVAVPLLDAAKDEISVVARGAMLKALRETGVTLQTGGKEFKARLATATDDSSQLPLQDVVLVTVKAHAVPGAAAAIARLLAPQGCAVFLLNGIPWWWNHGHTGAVGTLPLLDPDGTIWNVVKPERSIGCVVSGPTDIPKPGVIVHTGVFKLTIGEPDGSLSPRLKAVGDMNERLRTTTTILRRYLSADHFEGKKRLSDANFWKNGPPREGFLRIWQEFDTVVPPPTPPPTRGS